MARQIKERNVLPSDCQFVQQEDKKENTSAFNIKHGRFVPPLIQQRKL